MKTKCSRTFIAYAMTVFLTLSISLNTAFAEFKVEQVADGVFLHYGVHEQINFDNKGDIANIGFIIGSEAVAVIDTGGSIFIGDALRQAIKKQTHLPIRYIILTHAHPDHIFGVKAFDVADEHVDIIGHRHLSNSLIQRGGFYQRRFIDEAGFSKSDLQLLPPTVLVDSDLQIDIGDRVLTLRAHKTAHTNNDLTVFDEKTKTIWMGDLLFQERVPVVDGSVIGWQTVMQELTGLDADLIIPGHGLIAHNWEQALENQHKYLEKLVVGVRDKISNGESIQAAVESVGQDEHPNWRLFDDHHGQNVSRIYTELEWE